MSMRRVECPACYSQEFKDGNCTSCGCTLKYQDIIEEPCHEPLVKPGFGLAQIKQQGMTFSPNNPEIEPWDGCGKEFKSYFSEKYDSKYKGPFREFVHRIAQAAWDAALLNNAESAWIDKEKEARDSIINPELLGEARE